MAYEFHYTPTGTGVISGKEVLEQTEDAINDLGNTAISGVQEALDKAEQALTNSANAVDDAQTALNTANNAEGVAIQAQNDVSNLSGTVTNIGNRVTTAEGKIGNLQGRMTTAEGNITNLQGRMTTAEGNIGNLQTAVSTAQATANSAQQTATTARQQSYVFRYSSTVLVASSTNSNTLLDNTDNLKVGDKVIDSSGVLFSITAIDTANSTFTIGTALIDLAQDSDVVHTSGNETVEGNKLFEGEINLASSIIVSSDSSYVAGIKDSKLIDKNLFNILNKRVTYNNSRNVRYTWTISNKDSNGNTLSSGVQLALSTVGQAYFYPIYDNDMFFGASTAYLKGVYTKLINSLTPSSLSLPSDRSARLDISSYFTDTSNGAVNRYTVPANGYVYLNVADVVSMHLLSQTSNNLTHYGDTKARGSVGQLNALLPVRKDDVFACQWYTTATNITLTNAFFIPCQGNV